MALDPRIPLMAQGINIEPRSNALMRAAQLQGTQDSNALRQMQMQQLRQAAEQSMMERQAAAQREQSMMGYLQSMSGQMGPPQPFNPAEAAQRLGIDGATKLQGLMQPKGSEGFTLPPGGMRFGPDGKLLASAPFAPKPPNLPAFADLQSYRDSLPAGDPRRREVQSLIDNQTRPPKYASAPAGPAAGGATMPPPKKVGPMSVTLQKELLESDDLVKSSAEVVRALESAKKQNLDAYSGYLAKPRAVLRSNLPGESASADATIDIDNLMTGQGLEQMKSIFGAAPTEGERKILLEMQASVDKTPKQREAIMDRAIAAAKRRAEYATKKAAAIRDGSYLTDGIPETQDPPTKPPAGKTVKRTGTSNGRKVVEYTDGSIEYAD